MAKHTTWTLALQTNAVDAMHGLFSAAIFRQQSVKKDVIGPCQFECHSGCMQ
jgi:hypothetical protein